MSRDDCIFCRIVSGDVPVQLLHDEPGVVAFRDANPQAPTHLLIVPRRHIAAVSELTSTDDWLWSAMLHAAQALAAGDRISEAGYRLVVNNGAQGGQTVPHLHLHLLGGRPMDWPPG